MTCHVACLSAARHCLQSLLLLGTIDKFDVNHGYRIETQLCMPAALGKKITANQVTNCSDQREEKIGVKGLAMINGSVNGVVMDYVKDGKAQTITMGWKKNGYQWKRAGVNVLMCKRVDDKEKCRTGHDGYSVHFCGIMLFLVSKC
jgi:hypothetical protein